MKSKRSIACEFTDKARKEIDSRDKHRCIFCGSGYQITWMHKVPRSKGGLGIPENGALGCLDCHTIMDNPIGFEQVGQSKIMKRQLKDYLEKLYPGFTDEMRVYKKWQ